MNLQPSGTSRKREINKNVPYFNWMKITAEQIQSGGTLSEALDVAEARCIYLSEEWTHLFSLP